MNTVSPIADDQPIALQPPATRRAAKSVGRRWFGALGVVVLSTALLLSPLTEAKPQREFATALSKVASLFGAEAKPSLTATLELLRAEGLPKPLAHQKAEFALAAPDRFWLAGTVEKERIELARNGQEVWIWEPAKAFALVGAANVPRFAAAPKTSLDSTHLGPLALPVNRRLLAFIPRLLSVEAQGSEEVNGERCRVLRGTPFAAAARLLQLPPGSVTLWVREADGWPVRIGYTDGQAINVLLAVSDLHVGAALPENRWQIPAPPGVKIERVALSHLMNFLDVAPKLARSDAKPLGAARGDRRIVATHGQGRLEIHDETEVLFLRGAPEEMGEQHGTLLKTQVRDLVQRVLYGVGVGSSFAKGRWFFGEIEECQERVGRFIDPRSLREMDALADAAGLDRNEVRLGNFFPEELFHCSGFALMGGATEGGRIFHGRILDYMKGIGLEADAVVIVNQPDDRHAWVNVGYAGFVGSVTAMNDQHLSIGEMGGRGEGHWDGKPMAQLVREVMENAGSLDEAIEIMRRSPRTCEYYYVIADGKAHTAVGIAATPNRLEVIRPGEAHRRLPTPIQDTVLLSAGERYPELVRRVQAGFGRFDAESARALMTRPVCMTSNIHSVLFAPDALDFWVANADGKNVASAARYTHYNLAELLGESATAKR